MKINKRLVVHISALPAETHEYSPTEGINILNWLINRMENASLDDDNIPNNSITTQESFNNLGTYKERKISIKNIVAIIIIIVLFTGVLYYYGAIPNINNNPGVSIRSKNATTANSPVVYVNSNYSINKLTIQNETCGTSNTTPNYLGYPEIILITPNCKYAYILSLVLTSGKNQLYIDKLYVMSLSNNIVQKTINLSMYTGKFAFANNSLYIESNTTNGTISVLSDISNNIYANIKLNGTLGDIFSSPNNNLVYVVASQKQSDSVQLLQNGDLSKYNKIYIISTKNNSVEGEMNVSGGYLQNIAISPNGEYLYDSYNGSLEVISTINKSITDIVNLDRLGTGGGSVSVSPDGKYIYVREELGSSAINSNTLIIIISASNNTVIGMLNVSNSPTSMVFTPDGKYAYITNSYNGTISVLSTSTNKIIGILYTNTQPTSIAITPNGEYLYIISPYYPLSVIKISKNNLTSVNSGEGFGKIIGNINFGTPFIDTNYIIPYEIAVSENNTIGYVSGIDETNNGIISIVSLKNNSILKNITIGGQISKIDLAKNGSYLYALSENLFNATYNGTLSIISTKNNTLIKRVQTGKHPDLLLQSPNGEYLYLAAYTGQKTNNNTLIEKVAVENFTVVKKLRLGIFEGDMKINPNGKMLYLLEQKKLNTSESTLYEIATSNMTLVNSLNFSGIPGYLVISPNGKLAYITILASNSLENSKLFAISLSNQSILKTLSISFPAQMAITPNGKYLYLTNPVIGSNGYVSVIATSNNTIIKIVPIGSSPLYTSIDIPTIAVTPDGNYIYVANTNSDNVSVISTKTNTVINTINLGAENPYSLVVSPNGKFIYVVGDNEIQIIYISPIIHGVYV